MLLDWPVVPPSEADGSSQPCQPMPETWALTSMEPEASALESETFTASSDRERPVVPAVAPSETVPSQPTLETWAVTEAWGPAVTSSVSELSLFR